MANRTVNDGRKVVATAGTAVPLAASSTKAGSVVVTAEEDNTGDIVVGASSVVESPETRRGHLLTPGTAFSINGGFDGQGGVVDMAKIFIDSEVNGDGVTFLYLS